jgi:hypothetical protein
MPFAFLLVRRVAATSARIRQVYTNLDWSRHGFRERFSRPLERGSRSVDLNTLARPMVLRKSYKALAQFQLA